MIEKIVLDQSKHIFASLEHINEKLAYYRQLSKRGLSNLSDEEYNNLKFDIETFFNVEFTCFFRDFRPPFLYRVSINKTIPSTIENDGLLHKVSQLLGAPKNCSKLNRCNFEGESIFYSAIDFTIAIRETQPKIGDIITVSEWKIKDNKSLIRNQIFNDLLIAKVNSEAEFAYDWFIKQKDS